MSTFMVLFLVKSFETIYYVANKDTRTGGCGQSKFLLDWWAYKGGIERLNFESSLLFPQELSLDCVGI